MASRTSRRYNLRRLSHRDNAAPAVADVGLPVQDQSSESSLTSQSTDNSLPSDPTSQVPPQARTYAEATQAHAIRRTSEDVPFPRVSGVLDAETVGNNGSTVVSDPRVVAIGGSISSSIGDYASTPNKNVYSGNKPGWTTVTRRRARSMEDLRKKTSKSNLKFEVPRDHLSEEQARVIREAENSLTPIQRAAICMRNEKIRCQDDDSSSESEEEVPVVKNPAKGKDVDHRARVEDYESDADDEQERTIPNDGNQTDVLIERLRDSADPDMDLAAQRDALETWNAARDSGIQVNAMRTVGIGEAGGSGSNNRDDAVEHPGVPLRNETEGVETPQDKAPKEKKSGGKKRRSRSRSRSRSKSKGKKTKGKRKSKSRSRSRKRKDAPKPMSSHYERKLEDAVRGGSKTPRPSQTPEYVAQPTNQLPKNSFLAKALKVNQSSKKERKRKQKPSKKRRHSKRKSSPSSSSSSSSDSEDDNNGGGKPPSDHSGLSDDSSSSSSESDSSTESGSSSSSSGDSSDDESTSSSSSDSSSSSGNHRSRRRKSKRKTYRQRSKGKRTIKPHPPPTYDGTPDAEKFHNWVMRTGQYCEEGNVPEDEQVMLASNFLRGKALSFFIQKVSRNHSRWTLVEFAKGLFNFCFPLNYRSQQRAKLDECRQGSRSVLEYAYEFEMLNNLVGTTSKREMAIKFWDGLHARIRRELHREKKNKEIHSYDEIFQAAELIELADMEFSTPYPHSRPSKSNNQSSHSNHHQRDKPQSHSDKRHSGRKHHNDRRPSSFQQGSSRGHSRPFGPRRFELSSENHNRDGGRGKSATPKFNGPKPSLTDAEKAELAAQNKCFNCKEVGHMARNCPRNNTFKSNGKRGPPGMSTNSLRYSLRDEDVVLSETTETLDHLSLNSLSISEPLISDEEMEELFSDLPQSPTNSDIGFHNTPPRLPVVEISSEDSEDDPDMPSLQGVTDTEDDWSDDSDSDESSAPASAVNGNSSYDSDSDSEYAGMPPLQDVSDTDDDWNDSSDSDSSESNGQPVGVQSDSSSESDEEYFTSHSWTPETAPEPLRPYKVDYDAPGVMPDNGKYHSCWFPCQYSEYIEDYRKVIKADTNVVNPDPPITIDDLCAERWDGKDKYTWASQAKQVYGYPDSPWSDFFLHGKVDEDWHPSVISDPLADAAQFILHDFAPFPGDEDRWGMTSSYRIDVWKVDDEFYEINDFGSEYEPIRVPKHLLETPGFQLATWYAKRLAEKRGIDFKFTGFKGLVNRMGDAYAQGLQYVLAAGIRAYPTPEDPSPNIGVRNRFQVLARPSAGVYFVRDRAERITSTILAGRLRDPNFAVVDWWKATIVRERNKRQRRRRTWIPDEQQHARLQRRREQIAQRRAYRMKRQGDVIANALEKCLEDSAPYPGDPEHLVTMYSSRFSAWTASDDRRVVHMVDREQPAV
ncbi:hypothetical protein VNI00_016411 [Paramarasmius palmivorus]|uniref:CCHC-type domain-containing protein n=1 Tax=Paramarasmius palmivorus TaxID=297713 RepID=A0AAW0BEC2_9AGAR